MSKSFYVRKVAILGSGVMGAQIGAHFGNAGIPVVLFDLKAKEGKANALVEKSVANLTKINPKPLASSKVLANLSVANYDDNLEELRGCDLIIEAIAERLDWKEDLYHKVAPYINETAIVASNTSGLSIETLAGSLPESLRAQFCGIHFFNPPRYMPLVELIPHSKTSSSVLPDLESFLVTTLGKSVIVAKDTPNFIANRLGVFSMVATCLHAEKLEVPFEVVDKLTGKDLGRAKSATFRTADVVGLDTFKHVVANMELNCKDTWESCYAIPKWLETLISNGAFGQKTKVGIYRKDKDGMKIFDAKTLEYRVADQKANKDVVAMLRLRTWAEKFDAFKSSTDKEAEFLWSIFRDSFHYAACLLGEIADSPREMDMALRWGFGWKEGLFEIWQQAGWTKVANWIKEDIAAGKTLSSRALPQWVFDLADGVYVDNKHFNIKEGKLVERKMLDVYKRQYFPELVINERADVQETVLFENDNGVKLWTMDGKIGIVSFKSKMCSVGIDVLQGLDKAITIAEEKLDGLVIWQYKDVFSVGANLEEFGFKFMMGGAEAADEVISLGHEVVTQRIRYSKIPVVAALKGFAFGGGCEIVLHSDAVVAALESYIGLVEAGVGIIPGWGGTKEMALRASNAQDPWKDFEKRYKNVAMAQVATSAREAQDMGFLRESDTVVMNVRELLLVAIERAKFMAASGYRPPVKPTQIPVFGAQGKATINGLLANMFAGKYISEYDKKIAQCAADVMCGGELSRGVTVSEDWLLKLEKENFIKLATTEQAAARIQHMLETGKPLRN